jgi:hypothetical protein
MSRTQRTTTNPLPKDLRAELRAVRDLASQPRRNQADQLELERRQSQLLRLLEREGLTDRATMVAHLEAGQDFQVIDLSLGDDDPPYLRELEGLPVASDGDLPVCTDDPNQSYDDVLARYRARLGRDPELPAGVDPCGMALQATADSRTLQ